MSYTIYTYNVNLDGSIDSPSRRRQELSGYCCNTLHVVGMPSQTIHFKQETYTYITNSKDDDQSFSSRARELLQEGMESEKNA